MKNILDAAALVDKLPKLLPETDKTLKTVHDGLAALFHAALTVLEFRLVALDEHSSSSVILDNILPPGWNSHGPGSYTFGYKHDQSSLEFLIKISKLGLRTLINAIALEVHASHRHRQSAWHLTLGSTERQSCNSGPEHERLCVAVLLSPRLRAFSKRASRAWLHFFKPDK